MGGNPRRNSPNRIGAPSIHRKAIGVTNYVYVEYPKALYRANGTEWDTLTVRSADEDSAAKQDGWLEASESFCLGVPVVREVKKGKK